MPLVSTTDAAYAAGFFDGEGHIAIYHRFSLHRNGRRYERFGLETFVSQVCPAPIEWLVERFGGNVYKASHKRSYDEGMYVRFDWRLGAGKAVAFLRTIRPFLVLKGAEADIAIAFQATMERVANPTPQDVIDRRWEAFNAIREARHSARK